MRSALVVVFAVTALALCGCSSPAARAPQSGWVDGVWVNAGAPKAGLIGGDWFELGEQSEIPIDGPEEFKRHVPPGAHVMVDHKSGRSLVPFAVLIQPEQLRVGDSTYDGLTFRYPGRIQLEVNPSMEPMELSTYLEWEGLPNTTGETHPFKAGKVLGKPAAISEMSQQKWSYGTVLKAPASLTWSEPTGLDEPAYYTYVLMGDVPSQALIARAERMTAAR